MKLTQKQYDKLWGEDGPYSQANLIIQTRILDDKVSRVFVEVEVDINPLTYEIIKQNINRFKNDPMITQLIDHADDRGFEFGFVSCAFSAEYHDESIMKEAKRRLEYAKKTIIKMHKFVMDLLDISPDEKYREIYMRQEKEIKITKEIAQEIMADDVDFIEIARTNVFCHFCHHMKNKNVSMKIKEYLLNDLGDIILKGTCETCGNSCARYIECGENPKSQKIAKKYLKNEK